MYGVQAGSTQVPFEQAHQVCEQPHVDQLAFVKLLLVIFTW